MRLQMVTSHIDAYGAKSNKELVDYTCTLFITHVQLHVGPISPSGCCTGRSQPLLSRVCEFSLMSALRKWARAFGSHYIPVGLRAYIRLQEPIRRVKQGSQCEAVS